MSLMAFILTANTYFASNVFVFGDIKIEVFLYFLIGRLTLPRYLHEILKALVTILLSPVFVANDPCSVV